MSWHLYDRNGNFLGSYDKPEAAMCVLGTGEISMKWMPITATQFIGVSSGGATRFVLNKQPTGE
jgi:hypothetical protein